MKTIYIMILALCIVSFSALLSAEEKGGHEIIRGQEVVGNFDGFEYDGEARTTLHIKLSKTGYRVSLPLAEDVEYLYKQNNNYVPYKPEKLIFEATIKAIVVEEKVVQVIVLEVPS